MKSKQTVLLKIFSKKKLFNKIDCNVSGAVKLALTEANTQKTSQGIFGIFVTLWQIYKKFFFKKSKNCRNCISWLCISCQPLTVALHSYPSRHTLLPKEQDAISVSPALPEWSKEEGVGKRSHSKRLPCGSWAQGCILYLPSCSHRCQRLVLLLTFVHCRREDIS